MLPIRFVAEGFCLGVAWEGDTRRVTVVRNYLDQNEYDYLSKNVPAYSGKAYVNINGGKPMFKAYEIIRASFEYYSKLDHLGRCDVVMSSVSPSTQPTGARGSISEVKPSGWINAKYDSVPGGYLYNRCHLIGWQLTGENANNRNLITGTRYLNIDGMVGFENKIDDYIERTGNHVMYRVTPFFKGNNLVADGVLLEAYSVEDAGRGISFCVYCYNVQPGITIDYATGKSSGGGSSSSQVSTPSAPSTPATGGNVYRTPSGKKYHLSSTCGGKNSYEVTLQQALSAGLTPCSKCAA
ncbi:MAG: DNA/RNA non-specific endonuclease [Clostridia bacterium]|nr:DNA/RNA non-specific endonuclease [Clostridia bacterium]